MARNGKIARLPFAARETLNQMLLDNRPGPEIIAWANEHAALRGAAAINLQNLSDWRADGFQEWLEKHDRVERIKQLSEFALRMASAGASSLDLPTAIAGGQLMEALEDFDPEQLKMLMRADPENYIAVVTTLAKLQTSKSNQVRTTQNERVLDQNDRKLALEEQRFQRSTAELFLKWYGNKKAQEIAENPKLKPDVKVSELRALIFGAPAEAAA